jgi:hypothetical protein
MKTSSSGPAELMLRVSDHTAWITFDPGAVNAAMLFVRSLGPEEAQRLVRITRTTKDRVRLRRAGIVLASVQGRSAVEAAAMYAMKPQYAREVIGAFNEQGFAALDPKWSGGRPARFGPPVRETVCRVAKTPPQQLGRPFNVEPVQAGRVPGRAQEHRHQCRIGPPDPAPGRDQVAGDQDVEGQQGPRQRL